MNYVDLFRATLPETALEIAALLVIVVDLGFLRKAAAKTRVAVAALLGVAGCTAALWAVSIAGPLSSGNDLLLAAGGSAGVAQWRFWFSPRLRCCFSSIPGLHATRASTFLWC